VIASSEVEEHKSKSKKHRPASGISNKDRGDWSEVERTDHEKSVEKLKKEEKRRREREKKE
jgi:hypothetical protein